MRLILLGAPGAGKGTQAAFITKKFNIPSISTGDMLRAAVKNKTELGLSVKKVMESGGLVSDNLIIGLVEERLKLPDCNLGFLLDGFPRTVSQANALKKTNIMIDFVLKIDVADNEILKRVTGRRVHEPSGRIYHVIFKPPKIEGKDDLTDENLIQRDDDSEDTVKKRLLVYHNQTKVLINYYNNWSKSGVKEAPVYKIIDGIGSVEEISKRILLALKK